MESLFEESWFYAPLFQVGETARLPDEEAFHMRKVLRIKSGTQVIAGNGKGGVFLCDTRITEVTVELQAAEAFHSQPSPPKVSFLLSLLKGKDLEEPVEGICQLPLHSIQLVTTDFTQEFKGQDHSRLVERLRAKSLVAMKQAKKAWLTTVAEPIPLREWRRLNPQEHMVLLHPGPDELPTDESEKLFMLVGPEGGFSESELKWLLEEEKCHRLGLGATRIRGMHAPLLACGKLLGMRRI